MRRTTILLTACLLLAGTAVGCSKPYDEKAKDCATALTEQTGGNPADKPTVSEAKERTDALDKTLAAMVRTGYERIAKDAADTVENKTKEAGKTRPGACEPLSDDDYTDLLMAKTIDGLGWTGDGGQFDRLKMLDGLRN
ncbi:hypothetical protein SZN_09316 [Streptomyces zinciresistens K42]|uniref:Lipoprotein n=1 Tax=Streptomyces zinciresistens K42 TaxID=700597 RepID=G2G8P5_9ACTN|nr:hypothetical protein [Streptomyces zinciresistens]EGX60110.1 hypothetical protein SZN_09316 [Streptomyces zinciresistens K42]